MDLMRKHLMIEGQIEKQCLIRILNDVKAIYRKFAPCHSQCSILIRRFSLVAGNEPNMIRVEEPVIIIGDIHGQFFDMIHMFEKVVDAKGIPQ